MRIAFLGGVYPDKLETVLQDSIAGLDYAADAYQRRYLTSIEQLKKTDLTILNRVFVGSWPQKYRNAYVKVRGTIRDDNISFIDYSNLPVIREISKKKRTISSVKKWYNDGADQEKILFIYSSNFSNCVRLIKKACPELKIVFIIPDMPKFTYLSDTRLIRKIIRNWRQSVFEKSCRDVDLCICITEEMKKYLSSLCDTKCIVIEGFADIQRCTRILNKEQNVKDTNCPKKIMYSGTLAKKYGILNLVMAFQQIQSNSVELIICGRGDTEFEIKQAELKDSRIRYLGAISNTEVKQLQEDADILVNPRDSEDMYTLYSFPSKTLEYLETGNYVVGYNLKGIPKEYYKFIIVPESTGVNSLAYTLERILTSTNQEKEKYKRDVLSYLIENKSGTQIFQIVDELFPNNLD